jgi:hypothetical protein
MSVRVCANGHLTGFRHCYCGADAVRPLRDRQRPVPRHELRSTKTQRDRQQLGYSAGQSDGTIPDSGGPRRDSSEPPFRLWRRLKRLFAANRASLAKRA